MPTLFRLNTVIPQQAFQAGLESVFRAGMIGALFCLCACQTSKGRVEQTKEPTESAKLSTANTAAPLTNSGPGAADTELPAALREAVAGMTNAVRAATAELKKEAQLAQQMRLAEEKLAAEKRKMADLALAQQTKAEQATQAEEVRLKTLANQIVAAERDLEARKQAGQAMEKRLKFIREVIAELAQHGMIVWSLEEGVTNDFKIEFNADKKLSIGAPPELGNDRSSHRGAFRELIKIISELENRNMPVRQLSFLSGQPLEIVYTRTNRNLTIRPRTKPSTPGTSSTGQNPTLGNGGGNQAGTATNLPTAGPSVKGKVP